ncbi:MAG: bifunctional DNA primase/polymerase [Micromonosporaceae bacterium]|nr:bifunctional DNA primase/polymerase [Micromonosporaceae bacterium]
MLPGVDPDPVAAAVRGLAVFPLPAGGRRPAPGWRARCTADVERLRRTWPVGANVGVGCRASRIVALDLDRHPDSPDGTAVFSSLCARYGLAVPRTLTVRTPGGLHLYFGAPFGATIASSSGGRSRLGPGIDIRGPGRSHGGYLVGPGSLVGGARYVVELDVEICPLPAWLVDLLAEPVAGAGRGWASTSRSGAKVRRPA